MAVSCGCNIQEFGHTIDTYKPNIGTWRSIGNRGFEWKRGESMATEGPKTVRGWKRKMMTGDGRKSTPDEKALKEMDKVTSTCLANHKITQISTRFLC